MPLDRPNTSFTPAEPGTTIGRFRIANVIADGASGVVYEAVESSTGRHVALRHLPDRVAKDSAAAEQFLKLAGKGLGHPNIVYVDGIERVGDDTFLVSEFVGGRPAGAEGSRLPWRLSTRFVRDAARALAAIHNAGLVHGQVKPSHLIVAQHGVVKLADLGLASLDETPVNPTCAAPELIRGQPADARTDLYALGATYFALLTGRPPFADAGNPIDVYDAILHRPLPTTRTGARDIPLRCDTIVQKLMAKDPPARYATAEEVISDLDAVLAIDEPRRSVLPPRLAAGRPAWRRPAVLVGGLLLAVALAAAGWYLLGPTPPPPNLAANRPAEPPRQSTVTNSIGMNLVRVPAGTFGMGDPLIFDARPPRLVKITRGFLMSATEVTQTQYRVVMGANPSEFVGGDRPVEMVTWGEATAFCEKLSQREAERSAGRVYRLPTEAEWEYSCRAGTESPFAFGMALPATAANTGESGFRATMPAGEMFPANGAGLFNMHGNVWEWCDDWYLSSYYATGKSIDPPGPREGTRRVARGGSWQSDPGDCRSAFRGKFAPDTRSPAIGFRVVCTAGAGD
jgi:formylglycine-generating enzyme required for sulfatase activity